MTRIDCLPSGRLLLLSAVVVLGATRWNQAFPEEESVRNADRGAAQKAEAVATPANDQREGLKDTRSGTAFEVRIPTESAGAHEGKPPRRQARSPGRRKHHASPNVGQAKAKRGKKPRPVVVHLNLGREPDDGRFNGVIGGPNDRWNFLDVGQPGLKSLTLASGESSAVDVEISNNDGEWGIPGHMGVYHAYVYHNCRCVDMSLTFRKLPPGIYDVYVFAHGDAPNQNAAIEVQSGPVRLSGKSTLNDGTWDYRSREYEEGNQFVHYLVEVTEAAPLVITSRRDGSNLSMFNAVQLKRVLKR